MKCSLLFLIAFLVSSGAADSAKPVSRYDDKIPQPTVCSFSLFPLINLEDHGKQGEVGQRADHSVSIKHIQGSDGRGKTVSRRVETNNFESFIFSLYSIPERFRQTMVDSFLDHLECFPFVMDSVVFFIYSGDAHQVSVPGDFNGWDPTEAPMVKVPGTRLWYRREVFKYDARLDYKFFIDGGRWILDPLNPNKVYGGFGPNSELRMPLYKPSPEVKYYSNIKHGSILSKRFSSGILGNEREVRVYLPPGYREGSVNLPLVLVHDGLEYLSLAHMNNTLDYLIDRGEIQPTAAVFVPPVDRNSEYTCAGMERFVRALVEELLPRLSREYGITTDPTRTVVMGSSAGANVALWMAALYPKRFGCIGVLSPYVTKKVLEALESKEIEGTSIYIVSGSYDHLKEIHSSVSLLLSVLDDRGIRYEFHLYNEGHSYGLWMAHVDDILTYFLSNSI